MKRYLYLWHRWLGIVLCLFMAMWFISGVVMMYVGYPKLTPREHLAHLPALDLQGCCRSLDEVLAVAGQSDAPSSIRLSMVGGVPRYLLGYAGQPNVAVDARSGQRLSLVDEAQAMAAARQFAADASARYQGLVQEDAWTHSRALDSDRPLHRVSLADEAQRLLYISSRTGAVVRDATGQERGWNWLGAWLHWLYPLRGGALSGWWADIVIYLALAATLMAVLGSVIGILRWRLQRPYRSGSRSPYSGLARWHHVGGLLCGALVISWIFSGLMSMNPWRLFDAAAPLSTAAYQGGELRSRAFALALPEALRRFEQAGLQARELEWRLIAGQGYLVAYDGTGQTRILAMADGQVSSLLPQATLEHAAQAMHGQGQMRSERLGAYDFYYYRRGEQSMLGHLEQRLPVLRVRFDDPGETWVHLDLHTGAMLGQMDSGKRTSRWLFALLHSWDWLPLLENRPLWDVLMLLFSAGGLLISLTGAVLGWRRLRRPRRVRRPQRHPGLAAPVGDVP